MAVCRRPDCDRAAAERALGFCAEDHAAYVRSREAYAALAKAAQVVHADVFAAVPARHRQMFAEYLVAVASEGLPSVPTGMPRSALLFAAAFLAHDRLELRVFQTRRLCRSAARRNGCMVTGGRSR